MWAREHPRHIDFGFDFRTGLFDEARLRRMAGHIMAALAAAARNVLTPVGKLEILTEAERRELGTWSAGPEVEPLAAAPHGECEIRCGSTRLRGPSLSDALGAIAVAIQGAREDVGRDVAGAVGLLIDGSAENVLALTALSERGVEMLLLGPGLPAAVVEDLCARSGVRVLLMPPGADGAPLGAHLRCVEINVSDTPTATRTPIRAAPEAAGVLVPVPALDGGWKLVERTWSSFRSTTPPRLAMRST